MVVTTFKQLNFVQKLMRVSRSHQTPTKDRDVRCDELTEFLNDKCLFKFPINVFTLPETWENKTV